MPALLLHLRDYDCIYSRDPLLMAFAVPMKMFGKILAIELHGIPSIETEVRRQTYRVRVHTSLICGFMRLMETFAIRSADLTMPVTERMRDTLLRDYGADERKITVVQNAVDTTLFKPLETERTAMRRKLGIEKEKVMLYISTFSVIGWRRTGINHFFRVADLLQHRRTDIAFLIVGSGPLLEEIKTRATRTGTSKFIFTGAVEYRLVPLYMNAADVYVYDVTDVPNKLLEKQGSSPAKILQAMSCGTPVIAPKAPDLETILRNSGGGLSVSSSEEVEALIVKFADSPELVKSMGLNARRYVEMNHDLTRLSKRKVELMSETLHQKRRGLYFKT